MQDFGLRKARSMPGAKPKLTQTLRIMKLLGIFLLVGFLQVSAKTFSQKVSISVKDAPLTKVFEAITKQTGFRFFYNQEQLRKAKLVSVQVKEVELADALMECFKNQPFTYSLVNQVIVVKEKILLPLLVFPFFSLTIF